MDKVVILLNKKFVGYVEGNRYYTNRNESNIFRKYKSICISEDAIDQAERAGASEVVFIMTEKGVTKEYARKIYEIKEYPVYEHEEYDDYCAEYRDKQRMIPLSDLKFGIRKLKMKTLLDYCQDDRQIGAV